MKPPNTDINGPWRFWLNRKVDVSGVSGSGHVADGVLFADGSCVVRWRSEHPGTITYARLADLVAIHGHDGGTVVEWYDAPATATFSRGAIDCQQSAFENCPFSDIGGLECRSNMQLPKYVTSEDGPEYLRGYRAAALTMFGTDWQTCEFGWAPAITIGGEKETD